jgi:hypothetical protein
MDPQTLIIIIIIFIFRISIFNNLSKYLNLVYVNTFHCIQSPKLVPVSMNSSNVYLQGPAEIPDDFAKQF